MATRHRRSCVLTRSMAAADHAHTLTAMDDERYVAGMPALDRQEVPVRRDSVGRPLVPSRVPETRPTPLQDAFIYLSVGVLICGVIAISALELGVPLAAPIVRLPGPIGGALLAVVTVDPSVRVWRSAWAWMPVDRVRGVSRLVWTATLVASLAVLFAVLWIVLRA